MLMSPNKGETAVHGYHCPGNMAVRMRELLVRPWVGICVPLALSLSYKRYAKVRFTYVISKRLSMEFQWDSSGISKGFHWIPKGFLWGFFRNPLGMFLRLLSNFRRISMGMNQDFYDLFMIFPWEFL